MNGHRPLVPSVRRRADAGQTACERAVPQQLAVHEVIERLASAGLAEIPLLGDRNRQVAVDERDVADRPVAVDVAALDAVERGKPASDTLDPPFVGAKIRRITAGGDQLDGSGLCSERAAHAEP